MVSTVVVEGVVSDYQFQEVGERGAVERILPKKRCSCVPPL